MNAQRLSVAALILLSSAIALAQTETNPLGIVLDRSVPLEYTPGTDVEVVLTLTAASSGAVTAVGLQEAVPPEWVYVSFRNISGVAPSSLVQATPTSPVECFWISQPTFPCSFAYTLHIPQDAVGPKMFSGSVHYRLDGPEFTSDAETSQIASASAEGEGEGEGANELGLTLDRAVPGGYTPGGSFEITVTISVEQAGDIRAMGLNETIPPGWTFERLVSASGALPGVAPAAGNTGTLTFAWIAIPILPYTLTYAVVPASGDDGTKTISGYVEYRTGGAAQYSNTELTQVERATLDPKVLCCSGSAESGAAGHGSDWFVMAVLAVALCFAAKSNRFAYRKL